MTKPRLTLELFDDALKEAPCKVVEDALGDAGMNVASLITRGLQTVREHSLVGTSPEIGSEGMQITEVRITLQDTPKLKAFVSVIFDGAFVVRGVKVIEGKQGLFVAMPSRRREDGKFEDICHPINRPARERIAKRILDAYHEAKEDIRVTT